MNAIEARAHGGDMGSQGDAPEPDETAMSEPEAPGEFVGCEGCPCEHDGGGEGGHVNGSVWWSDYEAPDKPIADYSAREVGIQGECLAARYLARRGLEVMAQNWRCRAGEVDIVAREEDGEVALVEVKTRLNLDGDPQSMPELAVDGNKQRRYRQIALAYLMCHPEVQRMRFDVIAININGDHNAKLRHLVGTFTWDS